MYKTHKGEIFSSDNYHYLILIDILKNRKQIKFKFLSKYFGILTFLLAVSPIFT